MKKFLFGLFLFGLAIFKWDNATVDFLPIDSAWAQNILCPDRSSTDSSNACANTRFVAGAVVNPGIPLASALPTPYTLFARVGGSDSADCKAATVTGGHGPCLTIGHTAALLATYNAGAHNVTVDVGAGSWAEALLFTNLNLGNGSAGGVTIGYVFTYFILNGTGVTTIIDLPASAPACGTLTLSGSAYVVLTNLKIGAASPTPCGGSASAIFSQAGSRLIIGSGVTFGAAQSQHMHIEGGAYVEVASNYHIGGSAAVHVGMSNGGIFINDGYTAICDGNYSFTTGFYFMQSGAAATALNGSGFSGCGSATGRKLVMQSNTIFDANGSTSYYASIPGGNLETLLYGFAYYTPWPAPTLGSCTNGALQSSVDDHWIQVGFSGASASCVINFGIKPKLFIPVCVVSISGGSTIPTISADVNTVTVAGSFVNGNSIFVNCGP